MKGDFSRETFEARKHYAGVLWQQGRVQLDADWNEQQSIHRHRTTTESKDVVGPSGAPLHDAGFLISTPDGKTINIGRGRYYVNGLLCENESDIAYTAQPDFPNAPDVIKVLSAAQATAAVIYIDVCYRHITAIDDPLIREVALGGPDTTTRMRTTWQIKALPIKSAGGVSCGDTLKEWDALVTPSSGMLSARAQPTQSTDNPCLLPPSAGYRRLENQLYRVEVHSGGDLGVATFKWSRDNGGIVTAIETINGQDVTVHDLGRDDILGFSGGQFVEITDDVHELSGQPGQLVQIDRINTATRVITVRPAPTGMDTTKRAKLRRWDGAGAVPVAIPAANDGWIPLEDGVEVLFAKGTYVAGDHWVIPARTVTGNVEWPFASPQRSKGTAHHYSRLAVATLTGNTLALQDCRKIFSPLSERPPALHVTAINWLNDDVISQDLIQSNGLQVFFDGPVTLPATDGVLGIVAVTLEMPLVVKADATMAAGPAEAQMAGQFSAILNGELSFPAPTTLQWKPAKNAAEFKSLASLLANQRISRVRMRFLLKGHALWQERDTGFLYLDGHALGQSGFRADGKPRIDLEFPSGDNRRSSDFESWFYLQLQIPPPKLVALTLSSPTVIAGNPVTGTVMLDFPSATASTIKLTTGATQITAPATVTIPAGQTQITFPVTTAATLSSTLNVGITATFSVGGVDTSVQAPLEVQVVSVTIAPAEMSLFTSHSQQFTVSVTGPQNKAVNWNVQEAGGGSVNTSGLYTAPATIGTFHVVATSVADPSKKATAIIHVTLKVKDKEKEKEKEFVREVDPKVFAREVSDKSIRDISKIGEINNLGGLMPAAGQPILLRNAEPAFENPTGRAFIRPAERPETTPFNAAANP